MTPDFDKEIDALLRQAARGDDFLNENPPAHIDADEISAFAENALPQTAKMRVTGHLADCAKCRNILANVISLNAETAAETIPTNETVEAAIPWYKRFFAFPQLAYAMGALALVFSGVIGILVYQSARETASFDMAKVPASQPAGRGPNAEEEMPIYQDNLANTSNMTMMTNANASATPQISTANTSSNFSVTESRTFNTNAAATNTARTDTPKRELSRDNQLMFAPPPKPEKPAEAEVSAQLADESKEERPTVADKRTESDIALQKAPAPGSVAGRSAADERPKAKTLSREAETRRISGKSFNRKDGVWYDAAYRSQSTTNVRRSTEDYRKLESGLRVIAESLDGVVVVVWKEKAYRIQ
ncbi:MAG TPA: zf-HC2 domain-containing protein [Pyrinomonadaceae bacterium]|nr:zf-HC2 domain-containing protein [Pyrinomonadaceae bacterium]